MWNSWSGSCRRSLCKRRYDEHGVRPTQLMAAFSLVSPLSNLGIAEKSGNGPASSHVTSCRRQVSSLGSRYFQTRRALAIDLKLA